MTSITTNTDNWFTILKEADKLSSEVIGTFVNSSLDDEGKFERIQECKQFLFNTDLFIDIEQTLPLVEEKIPADHTGERKLITDWIKHALQNVNLATLVKFLRPHHINLAFGFTLQHINYYNTNYHAYADALLTAMVDLKTRQIYTLVSEDHILNDELLDSLLPLNGGNFGILPQQEDSKLVGLITKRRKTIEQMKDKKHILSLVTDEHLRLAWLKALVLMSLYMNDIDLPTIILSEGPEENFATPSGSINSDDELVSEIDGDDAVSRVDSDEVVSRVDSDDAVSKVDGDEVVSWVDGDEMVSRVDGDEVVSRVDKEVVPEVDRINKPVADHGISNQQQQGNNNSSYNTTNDIISINDSDSSNSKEEKYDLDESDQLDSDDEQFVTSLSPPLQPSQPPQQVQGQQEDPSTIQLDESGGAGTTDNDGDDAESLLKENRVCRKVGYRLRQPLDRETSVSRAITWDDDDLFGGNGTIDTSNNVDENNNRRISESSGMETDSNNVNKNGKRGGKRRFSKSNGTDTDSNDVDENGKRLNTPRQRPRHILIDNNNNDDDDDDDDYEPSLESSPRRTIPFPQDRTPELESQAPSRGINLTATTSSQQDRTHELRLQIPARRPNLTASSSQSTSKPRRRKIFWTSDEIAALQEGLEIYQQRAWQSILVQFRERFHPSRTGMDLRDKAKNEIKQRLTRNEPLEAFKYAQ